MLRLRVAPESTLATGGCSRFFHQLPGGMGTGMHESLPSYIDRLANRHAIASGPFFLNEVHPKPVPSSGSLLGRHSRGLLLGTGYAERIAKIVAKHTAEPSVTALVQAQLTRHISWYKDTRRNVVWCPQCLADWVVAGSIIYRPLLWAFHSAKCCPIHKVLLIERCPNCSESFHHLSSAGWGAYCPGCGHPLFTSLANGTERASVYDIFVAKAVMDLLQWGLTCCQTDFPRNCFPKNIESALEQLGGEYVMGELVGLSRPVLQRWRRRRGRPTLPGIVRLSHCFDFPLHHWISRSIPASKVAEPRRQLVDGSLLYHRHPARSAVREAVKKYLAKPPEPPVSLLALAKSIGTSSYKMYRTCPDLAAQVVELYARHRTQLKEKRQAERVRLIREAIAEVSKVSTPVSRNAVISLLTARGVTCSWLLKEVFRQEAKRTGHPIAD